MCHPRWGFMERNESVTQGLTPLPGGYHPFGVWMCDVQEYLLYVVVNQVSIVLMQ